ncbi:putative actin, partial [Pavlovales sp. CCMP2436]
TTTQPRALSESFEMPDGSEVVMTSERFRCAEAFFDPSLLGMEEEGLTQTITNSGVDLRRDLCASIVLSGGASLTAGLAARLEVELTDAVAANVRVKVHAEPNRQLLSWQGGALLSSLPDFQQMWISRAEYVVSGPTIVHTRCVATHQQSQK